MRKCLLIFLCATSLFLLSACATEGLFESVVNTWIGTPADQLTTGGWGEPDQEVVLPNGNVEYIYSMSENPKDILPDACFVFFEVDQHTQKIIHIRHKGNRCRQSPFN